MSTHRTHAASRRFKQHSPLPALCLVYFMTHFILHCTPRCQCWRCLDCCQLQLGARFPLLSLSLCSLPSISFACCRQMPFTKLMHSVATIHYVMRLCLGFVLHFDNTFSCAQENLSGVGIKCKMSYFYLVPASHSR